jgi:Ankyrin repeats (3 copies)
MADVDSSENERRAQEIAHALEEDDGAAALRLIESTPPSALTALCAYRSECDEGTLLHATADYVGQVTAHDDADVHARAEMRVRLCEALLRAGIDPTAVTDQGSTAFCVAALNTHFRMAAMLLPLCGSGGVDEAEQQFGATVLHRAAENSQSNVCTWLVANGADVAARDHHGYTPLHYAAIGGASEAVRALLEAGADPTARCDYERSPMNVAAEWVRTELEEACAAYAHTKPARSK